ncbi:MAG TPA: hypothetical protein VF285_03030 [Castellaniella sp.]|uniref:DUF7940 domain-containing protein n=1 Tax=Castellaniella sp. TaxID=1955812 RepID=UPI002F22DE4D
MMKLIPEWRSCHRFWSVRLQAAGLGILGVLQAFPESVAHVWLILPAEIHSAIPDAALKWVGYTCLAAGILARIIRQDRLHTTDDGLGGEGKPSIPGNGR